MKKGRLQVSKNAENKDFPGSPAVENPPANSGDTGSIPGLGRIYLSQSNEACVP